MCKGGIAAGVPPIFIHKTLIMIRTKEQTAFSNCKTHGQRWFDPINGQYPSLCDSSECPHCRAAKSTAAEADVIQRKMLFGEKALTLDDLLQASLAVGELDVPTVAYIRSNLTKEEAIEYLKCSRDAVYFMEKYCMIDGSPIHLRDYQENFFTIWRSTNLKSTKQEALAHLRSNYPTKMGYILTDLNPFNWEHISLGKMQLIRITDELFYFDEEYMPMICFQKQYKDDHDYNIYRGDGGSKQFLFELEPGYFWRLKLTTD